MADEKKLVSQNYQMELVKLAIESNTIIYLPSIPGKSFIAVLVLKHLSAPLLRSYSDGGKNTLILVNSVPLIDYYAKYIRDHTTFNVGIYTEEMNLDCWEREKWEEQFNKNQVIVMTTQILLNLASKNFIDFERVNLLIFEECHRCVDNHSMRQLIETIQGIEQKPRILGLTSTLLNGICKFSSLIEEVRSLEVTYQSKVATVEGLDAVVGYSTNHQEYFEICEPPNPSETEMKAISHLREILRHLRVFKIADRDERIHLLYYLPRLEPTEILKSLINIIEDLINYIEIFGSFGGHIACVSHLVQIERIKTRCDHYNLLIMLYYVVTTMGSVKRTLEKSMLYYGPEEKLWCFSSDKVLKLFKIFEDYSNNSEEELCCLVFTKQKVTAKIIHHIIQNLKETDSQFNYLTSNFIVENRNDSFKDTRENSYISKKNREVLNSFINKEINVLVSTSVLEDVDIPMSTLVINFDKSEDYRSYIQSQVRARCNKSFHCTILEATEKLEFEEQYKDFQKIEEFFNDFPICKNSESDPPSESAINGIYNEDKLEPYFVNGPNSAQVNLNSSVYLLCHYCGSFQTDPYSFYAPEWLLEKNPENDKVRVVIYLPIASPILDPITGPYMGNKKDAKSAAALVACKKLHLCGELDDNLMPFKRDLNDADVSYLFKHWPEEEESESRDKNEKRFYNKEISFCLNERFDAGKTLHLHVINLNPLYKRSEDYSTAICYDLYKSSLKYGLLSPQPLPDLCKFPLYDSKGMIEIEIKTNVKAITFTADELTEIRGFHFLIFTNLLKILEYFLVFDNTGMNSEMLLVVPIQDHDDDVEVDFEVIQNNKTLKNTSEPTATERINLQVTEESHLGKIVSPWYRTESTMYVVTRVCIEQSALSPFPNDEFTDFAEYYNTKHALTILNPSQPLLQAKGLSKRLNTFKPRNAGCKRKKEKTYEELEEYLIPELVIKQEFPACLWMQARFLPNLVSRLTYLLKLTALRDQIVCDIGAKEKDLKNCPPLEVDKRLLNYEPKNSLIIAASKNLTPLIDNCPPLESPKNLMHTRYNKDFVAKMLEAHYYWRNIEEPGDIERMLDVTGTDVVFYEKFISPYQRSKDDRLVKYNSSLNRQNLLAITYNKKYEEKPLTVLDIQFDNRTPNLCEFYQALTTPESNDIVSLERLATLGNSFLKLFSSLYIFFKFPTFSGRKVTTLRDKIVSIKNLLYVAASKNLGGIVKNSEQSPTTGWVPPCFCVPQNIATAIEHREYSISSIFYCCIPIEEQLSGNISKKTLTDMNTEPVTSDEYNVQANMCHFVNKQGVSDETLANCVEALVGAYLLSGGIQGGIKLSEWFGIFPISECVQDVIDTTEIDPVINKKSKLKDIENYIPQWHQFEQTLDYEFNNKAFLLQALTHPSYSRNRLTQSYERLKFLGDAILDFLITSYIYEYCGALDPGQLTDLRSALVNNNTFASYVVRCGFHKFLLMTNLNLQRQIDKFADYLRTKNYVIDDKVLILLKADEINLAEYVDVPKVLSDIFEALAGAIYLDSKKDLKTVWRVFSKMMWYEIDFFSKNVPKDTIIRLYECEAVYPQFSEAVIMEDKSTMVSLDFMCEGRKKRVYGFGANKTIAKRVAAKIALRVLNV